MKKLLLSALFAFCFSIQTSAQEKGKVEFGFNVGYNSARVTTAEETADRKNGFNVGATVDYYFSQTWSIRGKLIYDQKGWANGFIENLDTGDVYKTNYELNYLTVPVLANWHFGRTKNWYLDFGPYMGFLLNAKETKFGMDVKEAFNPTDFGLSFGFGVKIPVSDKMRVVLGYDVQTGFVNIFKQSDGNNVLNNRYSINAGVNFLLK